MSELKTTSLSHKDNATGIPNITMFPDGTTSLPGTRLGALRNALLNGGMDVFQRETGAPVVVSANSGQYVLDRWRIRSNVIGAPSCK